MNGDKKLNIMLVAPPQGEVYGSMKAPVQMHMGLAYLAAIAEGLKHPVEIIDMDAEGVRVKDFSQNLRRTNPDVVGFTVTTPTFYSSVALAREVKAHNPNTTVIFGGIHATIKPHEVADLECVDIVVIGEGEVTFKEILKALSEGRSASGIKGTIAKAGGRKEEAPPRELLFNLDILPFPARHLFKITRYTYPDALYKETAPMITSRGCPGMCTYCNAHMIFKRVFRARSARNVVDEVELLVNRYGIREVHIWDDNFTTIKSRVFEIRDELARRKLRVKFAFPNGIRADFLTKEVLQALKDMGTYSIAIGVESGSQDVLNKARKGVKLERVEEVMRLAKELKLETWAFFMIGLPGDTKKTLGETFKFAKKINPDIAKFHILKPYPGTEVYDYLRARNLIVTEDYNQFGIHTPPIHRLEDLGPDDMVAWQKGAYKNFYFRPSKIVEQLFRVKTFNRFILNLQAGSNLLKLVAGKHE